MAQLSLALVERLLQPAPVCLVRDGIIVQRNLRKELLTEDERLGKLRQHGVENIAKVRRAYIESDGKLSVFK